MEDHTNIEATITEDGRGVDLNVTFADGEKLLVGFIVEKDLQPEDLIEILKRLSRDVANYFDLQKRKANATD